MHDLSITHDIAQLTMQVALLLIAAQVFGAVARRIRMPSLIGEMAAGVLLGPFALGAIPIPGFHDGIFPIADPAFPVSQALYGFAAIGAIVHVFFAGLESDPGFLSRIRSRGIAVALSSGILALVAGIAVPVLLLGVLPGNPAILFFAALSVSTSIGVQARVLAERHRLAAPEGSVILGSSLLHDGFAIILLSLAVSLIGTGGGARFVPTVVPLLTAVSLWVVSYILLLVFAPRLIERAASMFSPGSVALLALATAILFSGLFELVGIASIAGAYGVGLALSRTDYSSAFEQRIRPVASFFIPLLYAILGLFMDLRALFTPQIFLSGLALALLSATGKVIGATLAARAGGFTAFGGAIVGVGLLPRGEVGVIIAAVGVASGVMPLQWLKIMSVMIIVSTLAATPLLQRLLRSQRPTTRVTEGSSRTTTRTISFANEELAGLVEGALLRAFESDGFLTHRLDLDGAVYSLRHAERALTLRRIPKGLQLSGDRDDAPFMNTALNESIIHVNERVRSLTAVEVPDELRRQEAPSGHTGGESPGDCGVSPSHRERGRVPPGYFLEECVIPGLQAVTREDAIKELVDCLAAKGLLLDRERVLEDVLDRERELGTGMEHGLAIPHAKTEGISRIAGAVGIAQHGIDFESVDGSPSTLIILIISPREQKGPHLQLLAALISRLRETSLREQIVSTGDAAEIVRLLTG